MLQALLGDADDEGGEGHGAGGDGLGARAALDGLDDELDEGKDDIELYEAISGQRV